MNMVRRRILENPAVTNEELFEAAVQLEPSVRDLNLRQFNARYPLQVRRWELSQPKPTYRAPAGIASESPAETEAGVDGDLAPPAEVAIPEVAAQRPEAAEPAVAEEPAAEQAFAAAPPAAAAPPRRRRAPARRKPRSREATERAAAPVDDAARREVRLKLMRFAESIARAGTIPDAIQALAALDDVVDEIVATLRPA